MYFVIYKANMFGGYGILKTDTLEEAKEMVEQLFSKGHREVYLSQEIPMNIRVSIEI
jgi:TfoX/Sxy family transcriptional regulator of competence genes